MSISSIKGLYRYIKNNSGFSGHTVHSVIIALGYTLKDTNKYFREISGVFNKCSAKGANCGFTGFSYPTDTIAFFRKHRKDIVSHMERTATESCIDIITLIQGFGVFCNSEKPAISEVGKALWDSHYNPELNNLYNVFAWYTLEEVSHTWRRYLEDHQSLAEKFSA